MTDTIARTLGTAAVATPRWRSALSFEEPDGPPPKLAKLARRTYEATAAVLGLTMLVAAYGALFEPRSSSLMNPLRPFDGWLGAGFVGWLAAYAFGLSRGVARLASPDRRPAGPMSCAPLILHGLAGLYGSLAWLLLPLVPRSFLGKDALEFGLGCAYLGLAGGWVLVIPTAYRLQRSALLFVWSIAGPVGPLLAGLVISLVRRSVGT